MPAIPVLITIRSSAHREQAAEDETISMLTSGRLELDETRAVIRYEETLDESLPAQQVVMTINEDVYGRLVPEDVDGILAKYMA